MARFMFLIVGFKYAAFVVCLPTRPRLARGQRSVHAAAVVAIHGWLFLLIASSGHAYSHDTPTLPTLPECNVMLPSYSHHHCRASIAAVVAMTPPTSIHAATCTVMTNQYYEFTLPRSFAIPTATSHTFTAIIAATIIRITASRTLHYFNGLYHVVSCK